MIDPQVEELFLRIDRGETTWRDTEAVFADDSEAVLRETHEGQRQLRHRQVERVHRALEDLLGVELSRDTQVQDAYYWTALRYFVRARDAPSMWVSAFGFLFSRFGNLVAVCFYPEYRPPFLTDDKLDQVVNILADHKFVPIAKEAAIYPYSGDRTTRDGRLIREMVSTWTWFDRFFNYE